VRFLSRVAAIGAGCVAAMALGAAPALAVKTTDQFKLQGSNNYSISVFGYRHSTSLTASRNHAAAIYDHRGRATARVLKMDLGNFGRISTRFHAKKTVRQSAPRHCTGHRRKVKKGVFKGTIKFRGEHGYTKVRARKARGTVSFGPPFLCGTGEPTQGTALSYFDDPTSFRAERGDGSSRAFFSATTHNQAGAVSIFRILSLSGPASDFTFAGDYSSADVTPPAPFSGQGHYTGDAMSNSGTLNGNLKAFFPGKGRVPLAGPAFLGHFMLEKSGLLPPP
jgi:hypothetical protein